ncbi:peroxiredoxin [Actinokineospora bangkokensis]|uniref:Alkyl hydroperoxide reductase E n=1 Tax=Actinokineospora bangkokensis TaxID=1193682 RepID=A0A1Q9LT90_9PSEU|nr:peroxiredoxin [Actinokineospora bangkokensis]OLR95240.1 peroxiredoxin [Actinokineospora bangkokensis]
MAVEVGQQAPEFTLKDFDNQPVSLSSFRGEKNVLLVFYPFAFSGICQGELCQVRDEFAAYTDNDVEVLGVSVDTPYALRAWADQQGYTFRLLSDFWPHGEVAKAYGCFFEQAGFATRGTFLVDKTGTLRFAEVNGPGEARDQQAWKQAIAAL